MTASCASQSSSFRNPTTPKFQRRRSHQPHCGIKTQPRAGACKNHPCRQIHRAIAALVRIGRGSQLCKLRMRAHHRRVQLGNCGHLGCHHHHYFRLYNNFYPAEKIFKNKFTSIKDHSFLRYQLYCLLNLIGYRQQLL